MKAVRALLIAAFALVVPAQLVSADTTPPPLGAPTGINLQGANVGATPLSIPVVGTTAGTIAAGNDSRITGAAPQTALTAEQTRAQAAEAAASAAASAANSNATTAQTAATAAQSTAQTASTGATAAQSTASAAQATATVAQTTANQASTTAQAAQGTASAASSVANSANTSATAAASKASAAQTSATTAQAAANTAATTATAAQAAAQSASQTATSAQTAAAAATTTAQTAQNSAAAAATSATVAQTTANQALALAPNFTLSIDNSGNVIVTQNGKQVTLAPASSGSSVSAPAAPAISITPGVGDNLVAWNDGSPNGAAISSHKIYRSTSPGAEVLLTSTTAASPFTDGTAAAGTRYYYVVTAINSSGESPKSPESSGTPTAPVVTASAPAAPTETVTGQVNQISVAWVDGANNGASITAHKIYRASAAGGEVLLATTTNASPYIDTTATVGATYYYEISAVTSAGEGGKSAEHSGSAAAPVTAPAAPQLVASGASGEVSIAWTDGAPNGAAITSHKIYRGTVAGQETLLATITTGSPYLDTKGTNGTTYFYEISAVNSAGEGGKSNEGSAVPTAPPSNTTIASLGGFNFAWGNQATATASGGGSNPVQLSATSLTGSSVPFSDLLAPMNGSPGSYTAAVTVNHPDVPFYNAGIALVNSSSGRMSAFGEQQGVVSVEALANAGIYTSTYDETGSAPSAIIGAQFWMRVVFDGTTYSFWVSSNGQAGSWAEVTSQSAATLGTPDHIGLELLPADGSGNVGQPISVSMAALNFASGVTDAQAIAPGVTPAASLGSTNFVWGNQGASTFTGGGTQPLVLAATGISNGSITDLRTALNGGAGIYTATVTINGPQTSYYNAGLALINASSGQEATFGAQQGYFSLEQWTNNSTYASAYSDTGSLLSAVIGTQVWMRVAFDGTTYTFWISTSGQANTWTQLSSATASQLGNPDHIGPEIEPTDINGNTGLPVSISMSAYAFASGASDTQAAAPDAAANSGGGGSGDSGNTEDFMTTAMVPTSNNLPQISGSVPSNGLQLSGGATPYFDMVFGANNPGANITSSTQFRQYIFNNYNEGDVHQVFGDPNDSGQSSQRGPSGKQFFSDIRTYPVGDPNDLIPVRADGLHVDAICSQHTNCTMDNVYGGFYRTVAVIHPNMTMELDYIPPKGYHSWFSSWFYSGEQVANPSGVDPYSNNAVSQSGYPNFEIDFNDGFARADNGGCQTSSGAYSGELDYETPNIYGTNWSTAPHMTYVANSNGFSWHGSGTNSTGNEFGCDNNYQDGQVRHLVMSWDGSTNLITVFDNGREVAQSYMEYPQGQTGTAADGSTHQLGMEWYIHNEAVPIFNPDSNGNTPPQNLTENDGIGESGWGATIIRQAAWYGTIANPSQYQASYVAPPPATPTGVAATAGNGQVQIAANTVTGATGFNIIRGPASGQESQTPIATDVSLPYTDNTAANGTKYFYEAASVGSGGTSTYSLEVSATPSAPGGTGSPLQSYTALLGSNGGAMQATAVPSLATKVGLYEGNDPSNGPNSPGANHFADQWLGRVADFQHVFTGNNNESDFLGSIGYVFGSQNYHDIGPDGVKGEVALSQSLIYRGITLAQAATGTMDADWNQAALNILGEQYCSGSGCTPNLDPNQTLMFIRAGWEENICDQFIDTSCGSQYPGASSVNFAAAFARWATITRQVFSAWKTNSSANPMGYNAPTPKFVFCPSIGGQDWEADYPGDGAVDVIGMDVYVNTIYGLSNDPDTAWGQVLNNFPGSGSQENLTEMQRFAEAHGKQLGFPELGINQDGFGAYFDDFMTWVTQQNSGPTPVAYIGYWDSNASYAGQLSTGVNPETGQMFRYRVAPAAYPVKPLPAPPGLAAIAGNGQNTIYVNTVPSSAAATTYYVYRGNSSNGEVTATPVASTTSIANGVATLVDTGVTNGSDYFYKAAAGNSKSVGFLSSAESSATPQVSSTATTPADYETSNSSGNFNTSGPNARLARTGSFVNDPIDSVEFDLLLSPGTGGGFIGGYEHGVYIALTSNDEIYAYTRDAYGNQANATSSIPIPFPSDRITPVWIKVLVSGLKGTSTAVVYYAPFSSTTIPTSWSQLGAPYGNLSENGLQDDGSDNLTIGNNQDQNQPFPGHIFDFDFSSVFNGTQTAIARAQFDAQSSGAHSFTDSFSNSWAPSGSATIH